MPNRSTHPIFPERPERPLDLANILPITPTTSRRRLSEGLKDWTSQILPGQYPVTNGSTMDDEHKLIARYSAKLSGRTQVITLNIIHLIISVLNESKLLKLL